MSTDEIQRSLGRIEGELIVMKEQRLSNSRLLEHCAEQIEGLNGFKNRMIGVTIVIGLIGGAVGDWVKSKLIH